MARPQFAYPPELPTFDTPLGDAQGQACGQSFKQSYIVRQPYKGVTTYEAALPAMVDAQYDLRGADIITDILGGIDDTGRIMGGLNPDIRVRFTDAPYVPEDPTGQQSPTGPNLGGLGAGPILTIDDATNREAIKGAMDRAKLYLNRAAQIRNYWATEYQPFETQEGYTRDIHWPLFEAIFTRYPECEGRQPGEYIDFEAEGMGFGGFTCPTAEDIQAHQEDEVAYRDLIRAAMHWARCAQEAVRVVALHYLNKAEYDKNVGTGGFQLGVPTPPPTIPPPPIGTPTTPPPPPPNGNGDDDLPGPDDTGGTTEDPPTDDTPAPTPEAVPAKTGFAGLSTPAKLAVVAAGGFVLYRLAKR